MRKFLFLLLSLFSFQSFAQDNPKVLIRELNHKLNLVADYTANVHMYFDIPGVKMNQMKGKVFYKRPDKFKIRAKGIFFLPKQNPMQSISKLLLDTASFTAIISGYETIEGKTCAILNLIPLKSDNELILGKFWVDKKNTLVLKSQITTKNNGTILLESSYAPNDMYGLPSKVLIKIDVKKIKVPKMMAVDLNKKSTDKSKLDTKETGTISLEFSNYKVNSKFSDTEFTIEE